MIRKQNVVTTAIMLGIGWSVAAQAAQQTSQQQIDAQLKQLEQLHQQYAKELQALKQQQDTTEDTSANTLEDIAQRIEIFGFFRAKYDYDDADPVGSGSNNKHFYMDFEGKMQVSDVWDAHFQSETRKGYTVNQSWREGDTGSSDQDGTIQRIWVEGNPYDIGIALGTKWWGLGFQAVPFGHAADGVSIDYDVIHNWNAKAFWLRPRQGDLVSMPNGQETQIYGANITGTLVGELQTSLTFATNENHGGDQMMTHMGAVELQLRATDDILLRAAYVQTDADNHNTSQEYRIDYKDTILKTTGSYGLYLRYIDFEKYGDYSHDDEWGSLPGDSKGWLLGAKYVLFRNVVWENIYSIQKRNRADGDSKTRHLFRTQLDFHF